MRVSAAIMAHPVRSALVEELQSKLDREVPVVWDTVPEPSTDPDQRWQVGRSAWLAYDPTADYHIVLQDDVQPCRKFFEGLEEALRYIPNKYGPVCPYTGDTREKLVTTRERVKEAGLHWFGMSQLYWGCAIALPTRMVDTVIAFGDTPEEAHRPYDSRIMDFYMKKHICRTWYTTPSLVQHRQVPSLLGHSDGRKTTDMIRGLPTNVDWSKVGR